MKKIELSNNETLTDYSKEIVQAIQQNKELLLISPTGTGKTHFTSKELMKHFAGYQIAIFAPLTSIVKQIEIDKIPTIYKSSNIVDLNNAVTSPVFFGTYDAAIHLESWNPEKPLILIVDEYHSLINSVDYRKKAVQAVQNLTKKAAKIVYLTATPPPTPPPITTGTKKIQFTKTTPAKKTIVINPNGIDIDSLTDLIQANPQVKHLVRVQSKAKIELIKRELTKSGIKTAAIYNGSKDSETLEYINKNSLIDDSFQVILCTSKLETGVNITNSGAWIVHFVAKEIEPDNFIQFYSRLRNPEKLTVYYHGKIKPESIENQKIIDISSQITAKNRSIYNESLHTLPPVIGQNRQLKSIEIFHPYGAAKSYEFDTLKEVRAAIFKNYGIENFQSYISDYDPNTNFEILPLFRGKEKRSNQSEINKKWLETAKIQDLEALIEVAKKKYLKTEYKEFVIIPAGRELSEPAQKIYESDLKIEFLSSKVIQLLKLDIKLKDTSELILNNYSPEKWNSLMMRLKVTKTAANRQAQFDKGTLRIIQSIQFETGKEYTSNELYRIIIKTVGKRLKSINKANAIQFIRAFFDVSGKRTKQGMKYKISPLKAKKAIKIKRGAGGERVNNHLITGVKLMFEFYKSNVRFTPKKAETVFIN